MSEAIAFEQNANATTNTNAIFFIFVLPILTESGARLSPLSPNSI
jgi:hypothetical protein